MSQYEVTLEINSKSDAHAVRMLVEEIYDTLREEFREPGDAESTPMEMLQTLAEMRDASRRQASGSLTIVFEQHEGGFDE